MTEKKKKKRLSFKRFLVLLKDTLWAWDEDNAWRIGAALAYFTIFSLAPLLIIVLALASLIFGAEAARGQIFNEIQGLIGIKGATTIQNMLQNAYYSGDNIASTIFGLFMLIFGSSAVLVQLRDAINKMWRIKEKSIGTVKGFLKARLIAFSLILGIGFLLLVSLTISALLSGLSGYLSEIFPRLFKLTGVVDFLLSFAVITVLIALIFKILPNAVIRWRDVWVGAALISFLFTVGKVAIGFYLGNSGIASTFGAAKSLVIVMLWAFYSAQIFLFGVEFTEIYSRRFGKPIRPDEGAVRFEIREVEMESSKSKKQQSKKREPSGS